MDQIKNIIFDLGGVFLTLDYNKTEQAFLKTGANNFPELYSQQHANHLFRLLETGKISNTDFFNELRKEGDFDASNEEITIAWNAMLGHFPKERILWLKEISKRYKIFLFSNTNAIHFEKLTKIFLEDTGMKNIDELFVKTYYSNEMGLRKPDENSYKIIIDEQHLTASETLFIDDTFANIEGAKNVGLQTIFLEKPKTILELNL